MTTTIASLLKRLEAEEGRRGQGDKENLAFLDKLAAQVLHLNELGVATDTKLDELGTYAQELEGRIADLETPPVEPPPVEPPPVEPPPTEKPERIWNSISDWHIKWPSRPGAITEETFEGRRALKMAVLSSDGSPGVGTSEGTTRAQLETDNFVSEGEEAWFRGRFNLPTDFASKVGGWGVNVAEIYFAGEGGTSPPWQIQARGSNLECRSLGGSPLFWSAPLSQFLGKWTTYAYGNKTGPNGWLEMHVNDLSGNAPAIKRQPLPMGKFTGKERFIIQCYYPLNLGAITVYHENEVVMGRTLESVR